MRIFISCLFFIIAISLKSQTLDLISTGTPSSFRGLSVVSDQVIWVSGSNGMVGLSTDGGKQWTFRAVEGFEKTDFRDIEAFDAKTAVILGIAEPALILKTRDGGRTWSVVYTDSTKGVFLDAFAFDASGLRGVALGDPLDGRLYRLTTADQGNHWQRSNPAEMPVLDSGEAFFAASGTNIRLAGKDLSIGVTGGMRSRLLKGNQLTEMPILQGGAYTGANSVAFWQQGGHMRRIVVVGGDFSRDTLRAQNACFSNDLGKTWQIPITPPGGYRSCVAFLDKRRLITCGTSGVDFSTDCGNHWKNISTQGFHVCQKAKKGEAVFLAGSGGRIARLQR